MVDKKQILAWVNEALALNTQYVLEIVVISLADKLVEIYRQQYINKHLDELASEPNDFSSELKEDMQRLVTMYLFISVIASRMGQFPMELKFKNHVNECKKFYKLD